MVPCLRLVSDKINLELGFVGISLLCVVHPRPEAFRNAQIELEQTRKLSAFHPTFIPSVKTRRVSHLKNISWALDFDVWR